MGLGFRGGVRSGAAAQRGGKEWTSRAGGGGKERPAVQTTATRQADRTNGHADTQIGD